MVAKLQGGGSGSALGFCRQSRLPVARKKTFQIEVDGEIIGDEINEPIVAR